MSGKWYGINVDLDDYDEINNIHTFVSEATPVILCDSLEDLKDIGIYEDIEMVN